MQVLTIVTAAESINPYRVYRAIKKAVPPTSQGVGFSHVSADDHAAPTDGDGAGADPHPVIARLRANADAGVRICIATAEATNIERTLTLLAAADFVLVVVDALADAPGDAERIVRLCRELDTKVGFALAGGPVAAADDALIRALVKNGPVAPSSILDDGYRSDHEQACDLWKFLKSQMPEEHKFEMDRDLLRGVDVADRRVYRRWRLTLPGTLLGGDGITVRDISGGGLMFETTADCPPGERLQLAIPSVGPLEAEVTWRREGRVGARFLVSDAASRRLASKLQDLVDERRKQWLAEARRRRDPRAGAPTPPAAAQTGITTAQGDTPAVTGRGASRWKLAPPLKQGGDRSPTVIAVLNTKGGTGKSTLCIHLAISLMYGGERVVGLDLDRDQPTFAAFARRRQANPDAVELPPLQVRTVGRDEIVDPARVRRDDGSRPSVIVVDTPGQRFQAVRQVVSAATCVIVPINDSLVDVDVLADRVSASGALLRLPGLVEALKEMAKSDTEESGPAIAVLRNRLSPLLSRNKVKVADTLAALCTETGVVQADAMTERVIYREHFDQGLTVFDIGQTPETTLTMSHLAARQEVRAIAAWAKRARENGSTTTGPTPGEATRPVPADPE